MPTILMTGAAGRIGTMLRRRLARPGRTLRLLDVLSTWLSPDDAGRLFEACLSGAPFGPALHAGWPGPGEHPHPAR